MVMVDDTPGESLGLVNEYRSRKDGVRSHLDRFTRKAFELLPHIDPPDILDVGCGTGVPTMELLRLTNGKIVVIDIDSASLDILRWKVLAVGLSHRMRINEGSLTGMDLPDNGFDLVWSEG
jgi:ubiquinone/menaquinone biosynthesis C-methylase UbiE